jgi:5-methyltetrahydrofolate--homocysteine methyltransferase
MNDRGLSDIPVILGGAALTRTYVERDLRSEYQGRLFYGKDAFEGLHTMDRLMELKRGGVDDPDFGRALQGREGARPRAARAAADQGDVKSDPDRPARAPSVAGDNPIFVPPFLGSRIVRGIPLDDIAAYLNETALFRAQWGYRPDKARQETDAEFKERIRAELRVHLAAARTAGVLQPAVAYGYFAVNSGRTRPAPRSGCASPSPARMPTRGCRSPTSSGPPHPARPTTPHSTWSPWAPGRRRKRPVFSRRTTIRTTSTCTASASR